MKRGVRWGVIGVRNSLAEDFQFHCLDMEWGPLLALVFSAYFACSCLFAAAFYYISVRHPLLADVPHASVRVLCGCTCDFKCVLGLRWTVEVV